MLRVGIKIAEWKGACAPLVDDPIVQLKKIKSASLLVGTILLAEPVAAVAQVYTLPKRIEREGS